MENGKSSDKEDLFDSYQRIKKKREKIIENKEDSQDINLKKENSNSITIETSKITSVVISKSTWNNKERLDIRTYLKTDNYSGPTKKGVNIPLEKIDDLLAAINSIKETID
jgi:hypothetical protein